MGVCVDRRRCARAHLPLLTVSHLLCCAVPSQGTPSGFGGLHAHEEALEAAEVGEAAGSPSAAPGSPPGVSPAGTAGTAVSRAALAQAATAPAEAAGAPASPLSPRSSGALPGGAAATANLRTSFEGHPGQRAQRWYLPAGGTATEASEAAEPLLSGYSQDLPVGTPRSVNPYAGTPASNKAASAAAAAVAARSGSLGPGGELVAIARDVQGQDRSTDLSRALVFGLINSIATIPALVAYAAIVFKVKPWCLVGGRGAMGLQHCVGWAAQPALLLPAINASRRHRSSRSLLWQLIILSIVTALHVCQIFRRTPSMPHTSTSCASSSSSAVPCTRPSSASSHLCPLQVGPGVLCGRADAAGGAAAAAAVALLLLPRFFSQAAMGLPHCTAMILQAAAGRVICLCASLSARLPTSPRVFIFSAHLPSRSGPGAGCGPHLLERDGNQHCSHLL